MSTCNSYAAFNNTDELKAFEFERRSVGDDDIKIDILFCGVCHSDIHMAHNDWGMSQYPLVPGHEIIGRVLDIGSNVTNFETGELVGVGCMVDSCRECTSCHNHQEQFCEQGMTMTYGSPDKHFPEGHITQGGYSTSIVVDQHFVLKIPPNLDTKAVAPLLCAGITTYSPLRKWGVSKGHKVGIIGLGGLGHMGVKFAVAMGADVTVITRSESKKNDALALGAHSVLISTNENELADHANSFDFLLNTVPTSHDINPYLPLLKNDKTMVLVGGTAIDCHSMGLIFGQKNISGSLIGGIKETQEMMNFCGEHNIIPDTELIHIQNINEAYQRVMKSDVKYRFVIDMSSLKSEE